MQLNLSKYSYDKKYISSGFHVIGLVSFFPVKTPFNETYSWMFLNKQIKWNFDTN